MPIEERTIASRKIHPKHLLLERGGVITESITTLSGSDKECWIVDVYYNTSALSSPSGPMNIDGVQTTSGMLVIDKDAQVWVASNTAWSLYNAQPTPGDLVSVISGKKYGGQTLLVTHSTIRTTNTSIADFYVNPDPVPDAPNNASRLVPQTLLVADETVSITPVWSLNASDYGSIYQLSCFVQIVTNTLNASTRCYLDVYRNDEFYSRLDSRVISPGIPVAFQVFTGSQLVEGGGTYDIRLWADASFTVPVVQGWDKLLRITAHRMR